MSKKDWERARTDEQKKQRIDEIVAATARLYEHRKFEDISFAVIAKEAEFTRSNLYKYFSSKEEIFLEFLKHDFLEYRRDLKRTFADERNVSTKEFSEIWVGVLVRNARLLNLLSILNTFLEKNVSYEALVDFKRTLKTQFIAVSELLCKTLPALTPQKAGDFITFSFAMANGLYQSCDHTEIQKQVMERDEFALFRVDFLSSMQQAVEIILNGLVE